MNSGIQNIVISLGAMQRSFRYLVFLRLPLNFLLVARKIPFDDPVTLNYVRIGYVVSQVIMLAAYYYVSMAVGLHFSIHLPQLTIYHQIKRKNDQTVLKYGKSEVLISTPFIVDISSS